MHVSEANEMEK